MITSSMSLERVRFFRHLVRLHVRFLGSIVFVLGIAFICQAEQLGIPRISQSVDLEDFVTMQPSARVSGQFAVIENFMQSRPNDGATPTQKNVVHAPYDQNYLYVVFVCFDKNPERIASSISRREGFSDDE